MGLLDIRSTFFDFEPVVIKAAKTIMEKINTKDEIDQHQWAVKQQRDSIACYVGRHFILDYMAMARNETSERTRIRLLSKYAEPCGKPQTKTKLGDIDTSSRE